MLFQQVSMRKSSVALCRHVTVALVALAAAAVTPGGALQAQHENSALIAATTVPSGARFALVLDGVEIGSFTQFVSMVDPSTSAPSMAISLMGGQSQGSEMWAWHESVLLGDIVAARKSCVIITYDGTGKPIRRHTLRNAWPAKYTGLSTSSGRTLKAEAITIVHEGFEIQ